MSSSARGRRKECPAADVEGGSDVELEGGAPPGARATAPGARSSTAAVSRRRRRELAGSVARLAGSHARRPELRGEVRC
jgi:hypothetical protein